MIGGLASPAAAAEEGVPSLRAQDAPTAPETLSAQEAVGPGQIDEYGLALQQAALLTIDFDPWLLEDHDVAIRRQPVVTNLGHHEIRVEVTAARRAVAQDAYDEAKRVLEAAIAVREALEIEMEGYAIAMWTLGDAGLQQSYKDEIDRLRNAEPIATTTIGLVERVQQADRELRAAEVAFAAAGEELAILVADDEAAQSLLSNAEQIRGRFEASIAARSAAISRWTHEILSSEGSAKVGLATVTSVVVRTPLVPEGTPIALGEVGPDVAVAGEPVAEPVEIEPLMIETVVSIPPITVNRGVAGQVAAMIGAALSDGVNLGGSGYRDRTSQIMLRRAHCGTSGFAIFEAPAGSCSPPTARPGASQHELGLAIDFTSNGALMSGGSAGYAWMAANASSFGFFNLPSEAWHWSTTGG